EVPLTILVAPHAEVRALDEAEIETVLVVVTGRAQTTSQIPGRRVPDETSAHRRRGGESVVPERGARGPVVTQLALKSTGEMLAGQRLLVLSLMAAAALAVGNWLREIGMTLRRVTLPAVDALSRVTTLGVVSRNRPRVTGRAGFDVGGGPRDGVGV